MAGIVTLVLALVPLLLWYLYSEATRYRFRQFADLPRPTPSLLWGHGKAIAQFYRKGDVRRHIDYVFYDILKSIGLPPIMVLDMRPFYYAMCVIASHEVAEQVSKASKSFPYSTPKSPGMGQLVPLIGKSAIITAQGDDWKSLRKRYNTGFAPQHLITLLPQIMDKTKKFISRLDTFVHSQEEFEMDGLCIDLTFDIIGAVSIDVDLGAQRPRAEQSEIVRHYRDLMALYTAHSGQVGFTFKPRILWRRKTLARQADDALKTVIQQKFEEAKKSDKTKKGRSVLDLSLQDVDELTPRILQVAADQIKSFLFAGHDTTSILLQWAFYELSRSPKVLSRLREELDSIFGVDADYDAVAEVLVSRGEEVTKRLIYTSAIIKEILRLYPPAGTARRVPYGTGFVVTLPDGDTVCLDGMVLYNCQYLIHRDRAVYGETKDDFIPERWLGDVNTSATDDGSPERHSSGDSRVPVSAWRPFERGPRNCIGQELANLEARVILAVAVRRYDFEKVGAGAIVHDEAGHPITNAKGQFVVKDELFNTRQVTSKPFDGMRMRVKFHERQL